MNWLKRLFGNGAVTTEGDAVQDDRETPDWYSRGTAEPPDGLPCGGTNRYHSWKPRGLSESSESCLRCGVAR